MLECDTVERECIAIVCMINMCDDTVHVYMDILAWLYADTFFDNKVSTRDAMRVIKEELLLL